MWEVGTRGARSVGGGKRDRTADLLHAMQALSQLSYTPVQNDFGAALTTPKQATAGNSFACMDLPAVASKTLLLHESALAADPCSCDLNCRSPRILPDNFAARQCA
jgi:hypothetical protein